MNNPTWDDSRPHTEEEIKGEVRRMAEELKAMLESARQSDERAQRNMEVTARNLKWIREQLNVGKPV